jgi:leucyl aminopeptidase
MPARSRTPVLPSALVERLSSVTAGDRSEASWDDADVLVVGVAAPPPADAADPTPRRRGAVASGREHRPGGSPDATALIAAERYGLDLDAVLAAERVGGRPGEIVRVPVQPPDGVPRRLLLAGTGAGDPRDLRRAGAAVARAVRGRERVLASLADGVSADAVRALVEGLQLGGYAQPAVGTRRRVETAPARRIELLGRVPVAGLAAGERHARATALVRDLAATPSDVKSPAWLAGRAADLGGERGLDVRIWDEEALAGGGFGGLLAVGGGSATPPRLVRLDYTPAGRARGRVVLVGKGITYDTGGLSIKSREAMVPMKTDMAGAAVVLSVVAACAEAGVRRPVTALMAIAENAVGASSYRPGDVVRHFGGRTVEVSNTDAEGRMVLADALAYADAELGPDVIVDVATLTGAATLGLGRRHAALFTDDDRLAAALQAAGASAGEQVWRLPLVAEYRAALDSSVADLRQVTRDPKVGAGAVIAALFLREFAGGRRWAHLDIAGTARSDKDEHEVTRGPTGFGARLLLRWLEALR